MIAGTDPAPRADSRRCAAPPWHCTAEPAPLDPRRSGGSAPGLGMHCAWIGPSPDWFPPSR